MRARAKKSLAILIIALVSWSAPVLASISEFPTVNIDFDGKAIRLASPAIAIDGTTYLPVRAIAELLGLQVGWDGDTKTVKIAQSQPDGDQRTAQELAGARSRIKDLEARLAQLETPRQGLLGAIEKFKSKVFLLQVFDKTGSEIATGSAVAIGPSELVTNYHVIKGAAGVKAVDDLGRAYPVSGLLAVETAYDLAILRVGASFDPVALRDKDDIKPGEEVFAIGSPQGLVNSISTGIVSGYRRLEGLTVIQTTAPVSPGSSGGGLFDSTGRLVGITTASLTNSQNVNFAVPANKVASLLRLAAEATIMDFQGQVMTGISTPSPVAPNSDGSVGGSDGTKPNYPNPDEAIEWLPSQMTLTAWDGVQITGQVKNKSAFTLYALKIFAQVYGEAGVALEQKDDCAQPERVLPGQTTFFKILFPPGTSAASRYSLEAKWYWEPNVCNPYRS